MTGSKVFGGSKTGLRVLVIRLLVGLLAGLFVGFPTSAFAEQVKLKKQVMKPEYSLGSKQDPILRAFLQSQTGTLAAITRNEIKRQVRAASILGIVDGHWVFFIDFTPIMQDPLMSSEIRLKLADTSAMAEFENYLYDPLPSMIYGEWLFIPDIVMDDFIIGIDEIRDMIEDFKNKAKTGITGFWWEAVKGIAVGIAWNLLVDLYEWQSEQESKRWSSDRDGDGWPNFKDRYPDDPNRNGGNGDDEEEEDVEDEEDEEDEEESIIGSCEGPVQCYSFLDMDEMFGNMRGDELFQSAVDVYLNSARVATENKIDLGTINGARVVILPTSSQIMQ